MFTEAGVYGVLESVDELALRKESGVPTKIEIYCEQQI
jgi:hypothetical protein